MTANRDDSESFEGIHVDLPFVSLSVGRSGRGWQAVYPEDDAYEQARRRVRARLSFYRHLATFAAVMGAVIFLDLVTGGGISTVVLWIAGIWGAALVWHAFNVFVFPTVWSRETEERMIQEELRRQRQG
jgi:fatty acid desaturase